MSVYMYARVWRCNHSPAFVHCRQVSSGKDNNIRSKKTFLYSSLMKLPIEWKPTRLLNKQQMCSLLVVV